MRIPTTSASSDAADRATAFVQEYSALFGVGQTPQALAVTRTKARASDGGTVVYLGQRLAGLPVFRGEVMIHVGEDGDLLWVSGFTIPESTVDATATAPAVTAQQAAAQVGGDAGSAELGWFDAEAFGGSTGSPALAWRLLAADHSIEFYVDSRTGAQLWRRELTRSDSGEHYETFYCGSCDPNGFGSLAYDNRCHGSGYGDPAVICPPNSCWGNGECVPSPWFPGDTYNLANTTERVYHYLWYRHGRDGWDNATCGTPGWPCTDPLAHRMRATANWPFTPNSCNAEWRGIGQGEYVRVGPGFVANDVLGHEFTHGIVDAEGVAPVPWLGIEEGMADVFGEFVEQYVQGGPDWLQASGVGCTPPSRRNLADPPAQSFMCGITQPGPDNLANLSDCGSPNSDATHFNAGILGKAGYLMSRPATDPPASHWGVNVTGIGITTASQVWYQALSYYLTGTAQYSDMREALRASCNDKASGSYDNCVSAIDAVGLWTIDYDQGLSVVGGVARSNLGLMSKYLHYVSSDGNLYRRTWRCSPLPCGWKNPTLVGPVAAGGGPTSTVAGGIVWVFYPGPSYMMYTYLQGGTWYGPSIFTYYSHQNERPSAVTVNGDQIWFAWRDTSGTVWWAMWSAATGWQGNYNAGFSATGPVTLVSGEQDPFVYDPLRMYAVYRAGLEGRLYYRGFNFNNWTWNGTAYPIGRDDTQSQMVQPILTASHPPAAALYRGSLQVVVGGLAYPDNDETVPHYLSTGNSVGNPAYSWTWYNHLEGQANPDSFTFFPTGTGLELWYATPSSGASPLYRRIKNSR
ncbi:MAG: M4 family metallopeptidase [Deltaproteobacteria bacterium]|nr:M4 family metallopeptidase [Deltaproteobacteria bacterium]